MEKIIAVDWLIAAARTAERSSLQGRPWAVYDEQVLAEVRERVLDAIQRWCDCGKGDLCPEYGRGFNA